MAKADKSVWLADGCIVTQDTEIGKDSSVWYNAVIRGDEGAVRIGEGTNIQDNATVHSGFGYTCTIGNRVTVGHNAIVHGCTVGDETLIGMGAIIMNGAAVGSHCIIAAGALVTEGKVIPDGSVVMGCPGKIVRQITEEEIAHNVKNAEIYIHEAAKNRDNPQDVLRGK